MALGLTRNCLKSSRSLLSTQTAQPLVPTASKAHSSARRVLAAASSPAGQSWVCSRRQLLGAALLGSAGLSLLMPGNSRFVAAAAAAGLSEIEKVLEDPKWPAEFPFRPEDFLRYDESSDALFYDSPRFVQHIDDGAIKALTEYYSKAFPAAGNKDVAILDICSSWISHYPEGYSAGKISGLGMNEAELQRNPVLTDITVHDLNVDPKLPYPDNTFDVVTNAVSVDYLTKPIEVFKEIHRVLKPGGRAIMSFSNRCFPTKAIALWTATGDADHVWIVGSYYHYSVPGGFSEPQGIDISPKAGLFGGKSDPMYVVTATKA